MNPHYLCLKSNKAFNTRKGWCYVREGNELVHYSIRYQTRLLNAHVMLAEPMAFAEVRPSPGKSVPGCDCDECRTANKKPF